jgi:hypothetical protein
MGLLKGYDTHQGHETVGFSKLQQRRSYIFKIYSVLFIRPLDKCTPTHFLFSLFLEASECTTAGLPDGIFSNQKSQFG